MPSGSDYFTAPQNFQASKATARPGDSITFTWSPASALNGATITGYQMTGFNPVTGQYIGQDFMPGATSISPNATSYTCTYPDSAVTYILYFITPFGQTAESPDSIGPSSDQIQVYVDNSTPGPVTPSIPTYITVSEPEQGEPIEIAWGSVSGATYVLERSVNGGTFASVYSGSSISYTDTAGSTWTTVQYRVKAVVSGASSDWTVSAVRTVQAPEQPEPTTPAAGRLEQLQNRDGTNIYPKTVIEGVFRQSDGKSLSDILTDSWSNINFYIDPTDGHLYMMEG